MPAKKSQKIQTSPLPSSPVSGNVAQGENIQELYEYVQGSLSFIETKNGVFVALLGGLIATILSFLVEGGHCLWFYLSIIPPTAALIPLLLSFYPVKQGKRKSSAKQGSGESSCLFRCENIAKLSKDELAHSLSGELTSHKIEYIHSASKTIARKYRLSRISIRLLFGLYVPYAILLAIIELRCIAITFKNSMR
ncbi:MAG: hypothetical protein LBG47_09090 [Prevotellaceae bacterium]|jgi:hypothetical protein|nr:hypothetical protein [Prevotellaceae bacterium]